MIDCSEERQPGKSKVRGRNVISPASVHINPDYEDQDLKANFRQAYGEHRTLSFSNECAGVQLYSKPFQCCQMSRFITDEKFLEDLRDELLDQIFYEKSNDLYKFNQTNDLRKISATHVNAVRKLFVEDFRAWMSAVTGITFSDRVDLTSSKYEYTDVLLCHDDELDTRRIAFALYLVPAWTRNDGGLLDLFDMDEHGQPRNIVFSLLPAWNSLSWFEVTEASHHQVSEVLCKNKTRLSVHGWFHTAPVPRSPRYIEPLSESLSHIHIEEEMVYEWLNPIYIDPEVQTQVRLKFEEDSEIELQGFLKEEKYQELAESLMSTAHHWSVRGPPNKRNYHTLHDNDMPDIVRKCIEFLRSEAVFLILSNLTGLRLHRLAPKTHDEDDSDDNEDDGVSRNMESSEGVTSASGVTASDVIGSDPVDDNSSQSSEQAVSRKRRRVISPNGDTAAKSTEKDDCDEEDECNPRCRYEVRKWQHGSYTLMHDTDLEAKEFALDAVLYCLCKGWQKDYGGYTSYIAKGEDEELLTIYPDENSLALVYRDKETLHFVKHVNHCSTESQTATEFCDVSVVYYE